ncbi:hypothetical protein [Gordonia alkaliphila]|uniref:hypothetical protein n=1 Tax=Gordonia alkaliphila TaxID=1053547 RepID=UPI0031EC6D85
MAKSAAGLFVAPPSVGALFVVAGVLFVDVGALFVVAGAVSELVASCDNDGPCRGYSVVEQAVNPNNRPAASATASTLRELQDFLVMGPP